MSNFLLVFLGGGLGSILRYGIGLSLQDASKNFPLATFFANSAACLLLGAVLAWQSKHGPNESAKLLFVTGICGGFSTFSTFTAETWQLWQQGQTVFALLNVTGSLLICLLCLLLGTKLI
jgi:fluoride exporter